MAFMGLSFSEYWTPYNLFYSVFIFSWVVFFWDMYVACRQYKVYRTSDKMPMELSGILDRETFNKARLYSLDKSRYAILHNIWSQILNSVVLLYDIMPKLWAVSGSILAHYGYDSSYEILRTLLLSNLIMLLSKAMELPWSIYFNFVVQEKHGFNRQTGWFFAKDKVKKLILETLMSSPILAGILYIIKIGGDYFFLYLWAFVSLVGLFMMTIYPNVIAPIFDKYMPFPEGPLKDKINELASSIKFPLTKILVVEGSKRSSHSNAYVYGFFNSKRIVIFDTLMENPPSFSKTETETDQKPQDSEEQPLTKESEEASKDGERSSKTPKNKKGCNDDEIVAILGHELGHWKLNHALINVCIMEVQLFFTFMIFGLLYKDPTIYRAFGFSDEPLFVGLLVITQYIFAPYHEILGFLMTCLTRYNEFAADNFSKKLNKASDLRSALVKLCADNLEFPIYDWLYSTINHSHPPLLERLQALGKID